MMRVRGKAVIPLTKKENAMSDVSLLQDFITETSEHLEEMETNLLQLEAAPGNRGLLNDIFRSAHTIKGSSEYLGMEKIAELSHKLENLLEILRHGDRTPDSEIIDTLIDARDRMAMLVRDVEKKQTEKTAISDLIERIDRLVTGGDADEAVRLEEAAPKAATEPVMAEAPPAPAPDTGADAAEEIEGEEYDEELFGIFIQHLRENLEILKKETENLNKTGNRPEILDRCLGIISGLHSSANYMDYEKITVLYEEWQTQIEIALEAITHKKPVAFIQPGGKSTGNMADGMNAYIKAVAGYFPHIGGGEKIAPKKTNDIPNRGALLQADDLTAPDSFDDDPETAEGANYRGLYDELDEAVGLEPAPENTSVIEEDDEEDDSAPVGSYQGLFDELDSAFAANGQAESVPSDEGPAPETDHRDMEDQLTALISSGMARLPGIRVENIRPQALPDETRLQPVQHPVNEPEPVQPAAVSPEPIALEPAPEPDEESLSPPSSDVRDTLPAEKPEPHERVIKQTLRVDAVKIDSLMNQVGELVVSRAWFSQLYAEMRKVQDHLNAVAGLDKRQMKPVKALAFRINEAIVALGRVANELQEGVMKVRMLPIAQLFNRYPRLVRDLVHGSDKQVRMEIVGEETELDKMVIEEISDPLVHLIRNSVDHGCETIQQRRQAGKPEECVIRLQAYHESNHVVIEMSDDGRGIDTQRIRETALRQNLINEEDAKNMGPRDLIPIIMQPGFSTAPTITKVSGRGVGMDVVKQNVEKLNGTIEIDSRPGEGTRFRIKIPLTLAIIQALLVRVGRDVFTIPLTAVEETLRIFQEDITTIEGVECIYLRKNTISLIRLSELFGIPSLTAGKQKSFVVVVNTGMRRVGLVVDALIGQEETVIKPLVDYLQENSGFSGATILGDGHISLILDVYALVNMSIGRKRRRMAA
jgi:two-component system chemotaxis sensor kinase CheA